MRRPDVLSQKRGDLEIKMTPMIDVVFLLLVFFVWTTSFRAVEQLLPSSLSAATGSSPVAANEPPPPEADFDEVVVRVLWQNGRAAWQVNETRLDSLGQLSDRLKTIAQIKRDAPVILHPDGDVPLGDVIDVYDVSRIAGFEKIQFATQERI